MRLTRDDERARRICSLALEFMNAESPVPSSTIARAFYPDLSPDSFRRAFLRDREALAACGVVIDELPQSGSESLWSLDESQLAGGAELEPIEAAALDVACAPLLGDPAFPLSGELRMALAKLTRAFAEASVVPAGSGDESRAFLTLRSCLMAGHAALVTYTDAVGNVSERTIAPYCLFELRGSRYLVAGRLGPNGEAVEGGTRTYRVDRVGSAKELPAISFEVTQDFSVDDWRRLPFQIGKTVAEATFEVPAAREGDLRRASMGHGSLVSQGEKYLWTVDASDLGVAASWAVAQGIRPVSPEGLVSAWRDVLEGVIANAS